LKHSQSKILTREGMKSDRNNEHLKNAPVPISLNFESDSNATRETAGTEKHCDPRDSIVLEMQTIVW
jgi:hypothetical protein